MNLVSVLICCFTLGSVNILLAQNPPITGEVLDAADLSPSDLPSFEQFKSRSNEIKINSLSAVELNEKLTDGSEKIFALDAREKEEFMVSHIKNAKRTGYNDFSIEHIWMIDRKAKVVVYSNTGKRGLKVAQYLTLIGFRNIHILEGSLIAWKNAGYKVVDSNNNKTEKVHVGNRKNKKLLRKGKALHY